MEQPWRDKRGKPKTRPVADRFWEKVAGPVYPSQCWLWMAGVSQDGYGAFQLARNKTIRAHRFALEWDIGPLPPGLLACHRCDNPLCCNPAHLFAGTPKQNSEDMVAKGRVYRGKQPPEQIAKRVESRRRTLAANVH